MLGSLTARVLPSPRGTYLPPCGPDSGILNEVTVPSLLKHFSLWNPTSCHSSSLFLQVPFLLCCFSLVQCLRLECLRMQSSFSTFSPWEKYYLCVRDSEVISWTQVASNQNSNSVSCNKGGRSAHVTEKSRSKVVFKAHRCHQGTVSCLNLCSAFPSLTCHLRAVSFMLTKWQQQFQTSHLPIRPSKMRKKIHLS